jgi:hypothetical protein
MLNIYILMENSHTDGISIDSTVGGKHKSKEFGEETILTIRLILYLEMNGINSAVR